eukprot:510105_1
MSLNKDTKLIKLLHGYIRINCTFSSQIIPCDIIKICLRIYSSIDLSKFILDELKKLTDTHKLGIIPDFGDEDCSSWLNPIYLSCNAYSIKFIDNKFDIKIFAKLLSSMNSMPFHVLSIDNHSLYDNKYLM